MPKARKRNPRPGPAPVVPLDYHSLGPASEPLPFASPGRQVATLALLAFGAVLWLVLDLARDPSLGPARGIGPGRWAVLLVSVSLSFVPAVGRAVMAALDRIRNPSPRAAAVAFVVIALAAAGYFVLTAVLQDRDLFPKTHDDQSYLIQVRMLAGGRLWMPPHPLADFFDTFYVLARPKYASLYFPGAALMYVPTVWLHLPTWVMPALVAGAIVGLVYRIVTECVDGAAGALAALALASLSWFRVYSVLLTSHEPMLLLGLLLVWAWLRWRRRGHGWGWALAMGVFAGWGAITRPADAVCFAVPVGCGIVADLLWPVRLDVGRRTLNVERSADANVQRPTSNVQRSTAVGPHPDSLPECLERRRQSRGGRLVVTSALLVLGAAPFLALQAVFDKGVTGSYVKTPYTLYLEQDQPGTAFGFHPFDPAARPRSPLPQKQDYYDVFFAPAVRRHQPDMVLPTWGRRNLPLLFDATFPGRVLLPFAAAGVLGLTCRRRVAFAAVLPLFLLVYFFNPFFLEHYAVLVAPAVLLLVVLGGRAVEAAWPRARRFLAPAFAVGVVVLGVTMLPELNPLWGKRYATADETFPLPARLRKLHDVEPNLAPAVILFQYTRPDQDVMQWINFEPVYNTDAAWPDDAPVVRAHDLGPERNRELFDYYARIQPDRPVYRWDLLTGKVDDLGTVRELAASKPAP